MENIKEKGIEFMKRIKKIASLVLAMVMVLAMSVPVMAADNDVHTITVKQNSDDTTVHQYAAYQIFAGDLATVEGKKVLSNIIWGSGVNDPDALLAELKEDPEYIFSGAFAKCETAADVAKALSEFPNTSQSESGSLDYFAKIVEKHLSAAYESASGAGDVEIDVIGSGYYLVQDIKDSVETEGAYTRALLEVVGDSDMVVKSEVPHGDKQVYLEGTDGTFGNVNTGTTLGEKLWKGNLLNKYNGTQNGHPTVEGAYKGCTFGLVTGLKDGKIQYASGVRAPKLFNEGSATGKTAYDKDQYSLKFNRVGDTYTLTAVNGTGATGLESFGHPSPNSTTTHTHIWTNDFWPMDSAGSYGTKGHDLKFGSYQYRENRAYAGSSTTGEPGSTAASKKTFPYSDDGKDHNSYFGMQYSVEFELSEDYVGPLEYYFFGDDDMWVV